MKKIKIYVVSTDKITEIIVGDVVERFTDVMVLPAIREIFETFGIEYDVNVFKFEIPPYLNVTKKLHSGDGSAK